MATSSVGWICSLLNQQHKCFSPKPGWKQPCEADALLFFFSPFNKWDTNMNVSYINISQIYFRSLVELIKNFSFLKYVKFWNAHHLGTLREKIGFRKSLLILIYYHPFLSVTLFSLHFSFCFYFLFIPLKDLVNMHEWASLRKEKVEKKVLLLSLILCCYCGEE